MPRTCEAGCALGPTRAASTLSKWTEPGDSFTWTLDIQAAGQYAGGDANPWNRRHRPACQRQAAFARGIVPSINLEIYQDGGIGPVSLDYLKALKAAVRA